MKPMKNALLMLAVMTALTGVLYPFVITVIAQAAFPDAANGSLLRRDGRIIGSRLIGQSFRSDRCFWSRPSTIDYNPMPSGASNLSPASQRLATSVAERRAAFQRANAMDPAAEVPADMLFASGSGLDPDISAASALLQVRRIAAARRLSPAQASGLRALIADSTQARQVGIFKESRINALLLNLRLDSLTGSTQ